MSQEDCGLRTSRTIVKSHKLSVNTNRLVRRSVCGLVRREHWGLGTTCDAWERPHAARHCYDQYNEIDNYCGRPPGGRSSHQRMTSDVPRCRMTLGSPRITLLIGRMDATWPCRPIERQVRRIRGPRGLRLRLATLACDWRRLATTDYRLRRLQTAWRQWQQAFSRPRHRPYYYVRAADRRGAVAAAAAAATVCTVSACVRRCRYDGNLSTSNKDSLMTDRRSSFCYCYCCCWQTGFYRWTIYVIIERQVIKVKLLSARGCRICHVMLTDGPWMTGVCLLIDTATATCFVAVAYCTSEPIFYRSVSCSVS